MCISLDDPNEHAALGDPVVNRIVEKLYGDDEEAATPDAGPVKQAAEVLRRHRLHASMNICSAGDWRATADAGSLIYQHAAHQADALAEAGLLADTALIRERDQALVAALAKAREEADFERRRWAKLGVEMSALETRLARVRSVLAEIGTGTERFTYVQEWWAVKDRLQAALGEDT